MTNALSNFYQNTIKLFEAPKADRIPQTGETAAAESSIFGRFNLRQFNPDTLVRRKSLAIYDEMRIDEQVKSSLALKKKAVLAPGWVIEPASDEKDDVEIAEFVEWVLNEMPGSMQQTMEQMLTALDYGFSVTEKNWKMITEGDHVGRIGLKSLKVKKPHFYEFDVDDFGNIKKGGLIQTGIGSQIQERLAPDKFVIYTHQKEFSNWFGTSDMRSAYRSWWYKDNLLRYWGIALERMAVPIARGVYSTTDPNAVSDLKKILENFQAKTSLTYRKDDFEIDFLEAKRKLSDDFQASITYHNQAISRAILIPDKVQNGNNTGAFAQSKTHFDAFLWIVQSLGQDFAESAIQEQLIKDIVRFNFAGVNTFPTFKFQAQTEEMKRALASEFGDLVQKGALTTTEEDQKHVRAILNFPIPENIDIPEDKPQPQGMAPKPADNKPAEKDIDTDEEVEDNGKKEMRQFAMREKTRYEKRVNFNAMSKELDEIEGKTVSKLQGTLTKQKNDLIKFASRKIRAGEMTTALINKLELKFSSELNATIKEMFNVTYDAGKKQSASELPKKFVTAKQGIAVKPDKAIAYMEGKTPFVVRGIQEPLTGAIKNVLLEDLRIGAAVPDTMKKLEQVYRPYLANGAVIIDKKQAEPYRLETLVRTQMGQAMNQGRLTTGQEAGDFIVGYQFSEIIDDRTVAVSQFVDGKIIAANDPSLATLSYPLHYNDRGVFVFVTQNDPKPIEFMSDSEISEAINLRQDIS